VFELVTTNVLLPEFGYHNFTSSQSRAHNPSPSSHIARNQDSTYHVEGKVEKREYLVSSFTFDLNKSFDTGELAAALKVTQDWHLHRIRSGHAS
jgi:hypothetical protein